MHAFLVAEWKTIVAVFVFCGAIFLWFYVEELQREEQENAPYPYTCLGAGDHVQKYKLGTPELVLAGELAGFMESREEDLGVVRYEKPPYSLTFRDGVLSAIGYFPGENADATCTEDAEQWKKSASIVAEPIRVSSRVDNIYNGMIQVQERETSTGEDGEEVITYRDVGWIVIPKQLKDDAD